MEKISQVLDGVERQHYIQEEKNVRLKVLEQNQIQVKTVKLKPPPPPQKRLTPRNLKGPSASVQMEQTAVFKNEVNFVKIAEDIRNDIAKQIEPLEEISERVDASIDRKEDKHRKELKVKDQQKPCKSETECPECGKMFPGNSQMFNHYRLRHGEKSFQCPVCGVKYPSKHNVTRHFRNKHQGIKYPCNLCDYQATTQGDAKKHRDGKHSNISLHCEFCHFQTTWRAEYRRHMKTHDPLE